MDAAHCYLKGNADAVEFCTHEPYANFLAASTYTLQEGDRPSRAGPVYLFDVGNVEDVGLNLLHNIDTAGVFDIRWSRGGDGGGVVALAQADADGCLRVYKIDETEVKGYSLREVCGKKISSSMCLWLDWDPSTTSIVVGLSDGSASVVTFTDCSSASVVTFTDCSGEKISSSMCLWLDWDPSSTSIVVGLSDGSASVVFVSLLVI